MADFDEIADRQGWNEQKCLSVCREFITRVGLGDDLDRFAQEKAEEDVFGEPEDREPPTQIEPCQFEQRNPHEWYCTAHQMLCIGSQQEPARCPKGRKV